MLGASDRPARPPDLRHPVLATPGVRLYGRVFVPRIPRFQTQPPRFGATDPLSRRVLQYVAVPGLPSTIGCSDHRSVAQGRAPPRQRVCSCSIVLARASNSRRAPAASPAPSVPADAQARGPTARGPSCPWRDTASRAACRAASTLSSIYNAVSLAAARSSATRLTIVPGQVELPADETHTHSCSAKPSLLPGAPPGPEVLQVAFRVSLRSQCVRSRRR